MTTSPTQGEHAQPEALRQILLDPENQPNQYGVQFLMHGPKMAFKIGARQFTLDYEPTEPGEFEFMRDALIDAFSVFTPDVKSAQPAPQGGAYAELPGECDSPELCAVNRACAGKFGTQRICASHGQAPAGAEDETWCAYVAGMICTYLKEDAEGAKAKAIAGIIARRLMFLSRPTAQPAPAATPQADSAPTSGNWIDANDVNRLVRELDVALNGEAGAAVQASLCDVVAQVRLEVAKRGQPLLAAPPPKPQADSQPAPGPLSDTCDAAFQTEFCPYRGSPDPLIVWRAAWQSAIRAARAPADSGAVPAQQVVVDFAQVGTAGPFAVVDGRVSLPDATMQDLVHMLRPTFNAQAADSVTAPAGAVAGPILAAARCQLSNMRAQRKSLEGFLALGNEVSRASHLDDEIKLLADALDATQAADSVLEDAARLLESQPTQAQAGAVPQRFTKAQQARLYQNRPKDVGKGISLADWRRTVTFIEAAHGIKGGQHGAE